MTTLFYLIAIFPLMWEMSVISDPDKLFNFIQSLKNPGAEITTIQKVAAILMFGYFVWNFIGLFTENWLFFVGLFALSILPTGRSKMLLVIDAILSMLIIFVILLNKFHFGITF